MPGRSSGIYPPGPHRKRPSTICFLHGFPLESKMWRPQLLALSGRHRCLAPDFFGFGGSEVPSDRREYSIPGYADQVAGVIEALDAAPAVIVGLSMGGYAAVDLVRRRPELVSGLVLADTRAEADTDEARQRRSDQQVFLAGGGDPATLADGLLDALVGKQGPAREETIDAARAMMLAQPPDGWIGALEAMRTRDDVTAILGDIRQPVLVLVGEDDSLTPPSAAETLAERIPGARLEIIPSAGHLSNLEHPEAFNWAVTGFLKSL